jgi:hypothetical protein
MYKKGVAGAANAQNNPSGRAGFGSGLFIKGKTFCRHGWRYGVRRLAFLF